MKKLFRFILMYIYIVTNFGCSEGIVAEDNETFYVELNKTSENLAMFGYEIAHFNDAYSEVRNTLERKKLYHFKGYCESDRMGNNTSFE